MSFAHLKVLFAMCFITFVAGCGETLVVRTGTTVIHTPPRPIYGVPTRGEVVVACTTVQGVYDYLDGYQARGCQAITVNYAKPRSWYRAENGRCYQISQFSSGSWPYYTAEPGACRGNYRDTGSEYKKNQRPVYYDRGRYPTGITYTVRIRS